MNRLARPLLAMGAWAFCSAVYSAVDALPEVGEENLPPASSAQSLVISTGVEGGGYWSAGERMRGVAEGMGIEFQNLSSAGSLDNLKRLVDPDNEVNLAFSQADAAVSFFNGDVDSARAVEVIESIGMECVFVLTAANGPLRSENDLLTAESGPRIGIASKTSGVAVTFAQMAAMVPGLSAVDVVYNDTLPAMSNLGTPDATVDAVMVVHRPREHSPELDLALEDPARFRVLPLTDARLLAATFDGRPVYQSLRLAVPGAKEPITTICVRGLLLGHKNKLNPELRHRLAELVDYHWMRVYATE